MRVCIQNMRAALAPRRRLGARRRRRCRLVHGLVPERDRPGLQLLQDLLLLLAGDLLVGDHRVEDRLQVGDEPAAELRLGDRRALRVSDLLITSISTPRGARSRPHIEVKLLQMTRLGLNPIVG